MDTPLRERFFFEHFDLRRYLLVVARHWKMVAAVFVLAVLAAIAYLWVSPLVWRASSKIVISAANLPVQQATKDASAYYLRTQLAILKDPAMTRRIQKRLEKDAGIPKSDDPKTGAKGFYGQFRTVTVTSAPDSAMIDIAVDTTDKKLSCLAADAMVDEFIVLKSEANLSSSTNAFAGIMRQAAQLSVDLKNAEERLYDFKRNNNIISLLAEKGDLSAQFLAELNQQVSRIRAERLAEESQLPTITSTNPVIGLALLAEYDAGRGGGALPRLDISRVSLMVTNVMEGARSSIVETSPMDSQRARLDLLKRHQFLEAKIEELSRVYKEQHPVIQQLRRELDEANKQVAFEVQFAADQMRARIKYLEVKEAGAGAALEEWKKSTLDTLLKINDYQKLTSDVERIKGLYDVLLRRATEINISTGVPLESVQVLEKATAQNAPVAPNKMRILGVACLLGLLLGVTLAFGVDYFRDTYQLPEELEAEVDVPLLGVVPLAKWDNSNLPSHLLDRLSADSPLPEAYRNVRSALLFAVPGPQSRAVVITSSVASEGKTTTALNLAISFAITGNRVLLVDADLRRGVIMEHFGRSDAPGLSEVLAGEMESQAVIQAIEHLPNLHVLPCGKYPANPAELLLSPKFSELLQAARQQYDRIVIDCPPVLGVSDACAIGAAADTTLLLVAANLTERRAVWRALREMKARSIKVAGCVLNDFEMTGAGYYYSSYYKYQQRPGPGGGGRGPSSWLRRWRSS